jgi:RNase adaptor protein for sRNA GlmZ degradation
MDPSAKLTVKINSFSYKRGIPYDPSGNGGGFVFDCRGILNPGRYQEFQYLTGKDPEVVDFFLKNTQIEQFIEYALKIVEMNIQNYMERNFTSLMISFGCTGGQHRSVYCAEKLARTLEEKHTVQVILEHLELPKTGKQ